MRLKALLAAAAAAALPPPRRRTPQTLRWAAQNDILTLDPHSQNHATTNAILMHAYEGLTRYNANYEVEPALATKWTFTQPDAGALRAAPRRQVPRRHAVHRRRRGVHASTASSSRRARCRSTSPASARSARSTTHTVDFILAAPEPDPAAQHHRLPHHEQGLGGEEPHHQRAGLQGQGRELRVAQRDGHRSLQDHRAGRPSSASR